MTEVSGASSTRGRDVDDLRLMPLPPSDGEEGSYMSDGEGLAFALDKSSSSS